MKPLFVLVQPSRGDESGDVTTTEAVITSGANDVRFKVVS